MYFFKKASLKIFPGGSRRRLASWAPMGSAIKGSLHTPPDSEVGGSFELAILGPKEMYKKDTKTATSRTFKHFLSKAQFSLMTFDVSNRGKAILSYLNECSELPIWLWHNQRFVTVRRTLLRGTTEYSMSPNQTTGEVNLKLGVFAYLHNAYPSFQTGIKHAICPMLMDADLPQIRQINSEKLFESDLYI